MKKNLSSLLLATSLLCITSSAAPKPVVVFDIHGVLLKEDLAALIKKQIATLMQTRRSLKDNSFYNLLCELMTAYRPLGNPVAPYSEEYGIPYEVFVLFAGLADPSVVYGALTNMVANAHLDDQTTLILTALLNTLFQDELRISRLTPIPSGVALFNACLASPDLDVYIYSNAPTEWIAQYKHIFPDVFAGITQERILCSGTTGIVKPSPDVLNYIAQLSNASIDEIILIDDSQNNCLAAYNAGATGIHFLTPLTPPATAASTESTTPEKTEG